MIIVDSSVWVDYFNGQGNTQTDKLHDLLGAEPVGIGNIIYAEVLQGFRSDDDFLKAKDALDKLVIFNMSTKPIALQSAVNFRRLRKQEITVRKTTDMIIGTFCIENGFRLLQKDKDFIPLEKLGLQLL
jgi:predicted nucleic acid-binding protein